MELRNLTPFMPMSFESRDEQLNDFGVVIAKGTFEIVSGRSLSISNTQDNFVLSDEYYGDPQTTSLKHANDLAPFKPNTDVVVTATAYSNNGIPQTHWPVGVSVGLKRKEFMVTGHRFWVKGLLGTKPSKIEPVKSVPIRYENAFGGSYISDGMQIRFESNPIGTGYVPKNFVPENTKIPQILPLIDIDRLKITDNIETVGLGPVAPDWYVRSSKVGNCDQLWRKTRFPNLPIDFNYLFYNTSSPGMMLDGYAQGNEIVSLDNLTKDGKVCFKLPGIHVASLIRYETGEMVPGPMPLDTIHIDCLERKVHLIWRGVFPIHTPVRVLEIRTDLVNKRAL